MIAPRFWSNPPNRPGWQARLLQPATLIWRLGAWLRRRGVTPYRAPVPVVCVGNLTAGGAGKTPMISALLQHLAAPDRHLHVVTRGHGGSLAGPHRVDLQNDTYREVGDEAMILAALAPVWVARDRAAGVRAAAGAGADLILLDDGFQNPFVFKDRSILMVDAAAGFGNGRLIPAGPLRETVRDGLSGADLVVLIGTEADCAAARTRWPELAAAATLPARLLPRDTGLSLEGELVLAFAGIGRPGKFFATLRDLGARVTGTAAFADHCPYPPAILRRLLRRARATGAMLVTTEKDAVRLPPGFLSEVVVVQVHLEPADWAPLDHLFAAYEFGLPHSQQADAMFSRHKRVVPQ